MTPDYKQGFLDAIKMARCGGFSLSKRVRAVWEELAIAWIARDDDSDPPTSWDAGCELGRRKNPESAPVRKIRKPTKPPASPGEAVNFSAVPMLGTEIVYKGQRYTLLRVDPYTRSDGRQTGLLVWESHCADCGEPFEARTGLRAKGLNRRCPKHANPRQRVQSLSINAA